MTLPSVPSIKTVPVDQQATLEEVGTPPDQLLATFQWPPLDPVKLSVHAAAALACEASNTTAMAAPASAAATAATQRWPDRNAPGTARPPVPNEDSAPSPLLRQAYAGAVGCVKRPECGLPAPERCCGCGAHTGRGSSEQSSASPSPWGGKGIPTLLPWINEEAPGKRAPHS